MKKIIALLLALVMVFALVACAAKTDAPAEETKTEEPAATETTTTEETAEPAAEETAEPAAEEGKVYNVAYLVNGNLGDKSFFDSAEAGLEELEAARQTGAEFAVLDMPLLYEAGLDKLCDRVWCVSLPREMQVQRLMARDGFTRAEAEARLSSQMDAAEKARRADVVIDTSGSIQYTRDQIPALLEDERRQTAK